MPQEGTWALPSSQLLLRSDVMSVMQNRQTEAKPKRSSKQAPRSQRHFHFGASSTPAGSPSTQRPHRTAISQTVMSNMHMHRRKMERAFERRTASIPMGDFGGQHRLNSQPPFPLHRANANPGNQSNLQVSQDHASEGSTSRKTPCLARPCLERPRLGRPRLGRRCLARPKQPPPKEKKQTRRSSS